MKTAFQPIRSMDELDQVFAQSAAAPRILFKHDPSCMISAAAHRELSQMEQPVLLVDVENDHDLRDAVTQRTGVRHESPQALVLKNGQAAWSASHYEITHEAVAEAVERANI